MISGTESSETGREYAMAYTAHYSDRDLPLALTLYEKLIAAHPDTQEAGFSRMQLQNIVNAVVPKEVRLEAQIELARQYCEHHAISESAAVCDAPLALGLPA